MPFFLFFFLFFFFFNDTATTEIYTLSLHDALPISVSGAGTTVFSAENPSGSTPSSTLPVRASPRRSARACICGSSGTSALPLPLSLPRARPRRTATLPFALSLQLVAHLVASSLEVAVGERVGVGVDEERGLHRVGVGRGLAGVDPNLSQDALA